MTWREDLRAIFNEVAVSEIPDALGELARGQAVMQLRLQAPGRNTSGPGPQVSAPGHDQQLTADEVASRLSVSKKWVYGHEEQLGAVHLSARAVRFSERAVQRYIAAHR